MSWILVVLLLLAAGSTVSATFAYLSTYRRLKRLEAELPEGRGAGRGQGGDQGRGEGAGAAGGVLDLADVLAEAPVGVYAADRAGRVVYVNRRLARWLAAEPEALSGVACLADWLAPASDGGPDGGPVAAALSAGAATAGEVCLRDRNGETFSAWIAQDLIAEEDGSARLYGVVRRLDEPGAAAPLLGPGEPADGEPAAAGPYKRFFDVTPVGIVLIDSTGAVLDHNRAALALAGLSAPAAAGLRLTDLTHVGLNPARVPL